MKFLNWETTHIIMHHIHNGLQNTNSHIRVTSARDPSGICLEYYWWHQRLGMVMWNFGNWSTGFMTFWRVEICLMPFDDIEESEVGW